MAIVMDQLEICAEKIRAVSQRARYRDYYDLYFLLNELKIDLKDAVHILHQKEIRTPIVSNKIAVNWSVAKEQKERDMGSIYCSEDIAITEIENMIQTIEFADIPVPD